jgi:hypothetical protein
MTPDSHALAEASRKVTSIVLQGLARHGQVHVAQALGVSESTVSRMKTEDIPRMAGLLVACGLKVVPAEFRCYRPDTIDALLTLARDRLEQVRTVEQLAWDE